MKKTLASVSPASIVSGIIPVVTEYFRARSGSRSSWRVTTGGAAWLPAAAKERAREPAGRPARAPGRCGTASFLAGLPQDLGRRLAEILHHQPAAGGRAAHVVDVLVVRGEERGVRLADGVGEAARRTQE